MNTYRPIDSKREEFRKYLERTGVMDAITKVLVLLYEQGDKPEDALEFMRMNLGEKRPSNDAVAEIESLRAELDNANQTIKELTKQLQLAKAGGKSPAVPSKRGSMKDSSSNENMDA